MLSVSKLADKFGISRSTLLYYDTIGLLKPSARNHAGYRLYDGQDEERLRKIMIFREAGVQLSDISNLLNAANVEVTALLIKRLGQLNREIEEVKKKQNVIIKLLENSIIYKNLKYIDDSTWATILESAGIHNDNKDEWHSVFEKNSPSEHHDFLALLGFSEEEITKQITYLEQLRQK